MKKRRPLTGGQKKRLALLGVMAAAVIAIIVVAAVLITGGARDRKYSRLYESASQSYAAQAYDEALATAKEILTSKKLSVEQQSDVYLLMADIYVAQGKPNAAQALLEDACSVLGTEALERRLLALREELARTEEQLQTPREELPDRAVYSDLDGGDEITIGGRTVSVDVTELELIGCGLTDISALSKLTKLQYLNLQDNSISDLTPLSGLTSLTKLILWDNDITNIYPLAGLTNLTYLDIDSNNVQDLTPLASLKNLTQLWCSGNRPGSLEPIGGLTKLTNLGLKNDGLGDGDLEPLKKLTGLFDLRLDGNTGLSSKAIDSLQSALPYCTISRPAGLAGSITLGGVTYYTDATSISCGGAGVSDISGLSAFKNLTSLSLPNNNLSDISALSGLTGLTSLDLSYNTGITSLEALSNLTNLTALSLAGCSGVTSATALYGLSSLWSLDVTGTGLTWEQVDMLQASLPACAVFSDTTEPVETVEGDIGAGTDAQGLPEEPLD